MNYRLHFASLELEGDIPCHILKDKIELNWFLLAERQKYDCVYLVSLFGEIFVTDNVLCVMNFIEKFTFKPENLNPMNLPQEFMDEVNELIKNYSPPDIDLFVQEYESFEDAYKVALDMQEIKPLCYSRNRFSNN